MRNIFMMAMLALALTACERPVKRETPPNQPENPNQPRNNETSDLSGDDSKYNDDSNIKVDSKIKYNADKNYDYNANKKYDNDNTRINIRDRHEEIKTPFDQGEVDNDLAITQKIRKILIADDTLSMNGKNIKIITINGVVTLRGPVDSPAEKAAIAKKLSRIAEIKKLNNQLEINKY